MLTMNASIPALHLLCQAMQQAQKPCLHLLHFSPVRPGLHLQTSYIDITLGFQGLRCRLKDFSTVGAQSLAISTQGKAAGNTTCKAFREMKFKGLQ